MRTLPDFTAAIQSGNETTRKSNYVLTSAENGPAMAGPARLVPAPMGCSLNLPSLVQLFALTLQNVNQITVLMDIIIWLLLYTVKRFWLL